MPRSRKFWIMPGVSFLAVASLILGGSATSAGAASPSGKPLVLGIISTDSGASGTTADNPTTVHDWANYVNSHGGINGHPVKIDYFNDADNSATSIQDATTLIQDDHVIAIGDAGQTGTSFASVADAAHVPVISLIGSQSSPGYLKDPNLFADSMTVATEFWAIAEIPHLSGETNNALLYCSEVAACAQVVPAVTADANPLGVKIVYSAGMSASAPNYTAICLAAKQAGANSISPISPSTAAVLRVLDNCAAQGYHPLPSVGVSVLGSQLLNDPNVMSFWSYTGVTPFFVKDSATKTIDTVMGGYLPHAVSKQIVFADWAGLQLFAKAADSDSHAGHSHCARCL